MNEENLWGDVGDGYRLMKGPLGGYINYIAHIALPNYIDYERYLKSENEKGSERERYGRFRRFLNTVVSFNNILEYMYHDLNKETEGISPNEFRDIMYNENPDLEVINDYANAYKHSIRGGWDRKKAKFKRNDSKKHAHDMAEHQIQARCGSAVCGDRLVDIQIGFDSVDNKHLMQRVFKYWLDHSGLN